MFKLLSILWISLALYTAHSQSCTDTNGLRTLYGFGNSLTTAKSYSGLNYCKSIKSSAVCCTDTDINSIQTKTSKVLDDLTSLATTRDKFLANIQANILTQLKERLENFANSTKIATSYFDTYVLDDLQGYFYFIYYIQEVFDKIVSTYESLGNEFVGYQSSRTTCIVELVKFQAAAFCLACDPSATSKGYNATSQDITVSDRVSDRLDSACLSYFSDSISQNTIAQLSSSIQQIDYLSEIIRDLVAGNMTYPPGTDAFRTKFESNDPLDGVSTYSHYYLHDWMKLFPSGLLNKQSLIIGGPLQDEVVYGSVRRHSTSEFDPDSDESGATVTFTDDPANVQSVVAAVKNLTGPNGSIDPSPSGYFFPSSSGWYCTATRGLRELYDINNTVIVAKPFNNLKYCKSLKSSAVCCTDSDINTFQEKTAKVLTNLTAMAATRDRYIKDVQENVLPQLKQNLESFSKTVSQSSAFLAANAQSLSADDTSELDDAMEFMTNSTALLGILSGNVEGDYINYQKSRTACMVEMVKLQSAAFCLACDPQAISKGYDPNTMDFNLSTRVCSRLQSSCSGYIEASIAQNAIIEASYGAQMISAMAGMMQAIANKDYNAIQDLTKDLEDTPEPEDDLVAPADSPDSCGAGSCNWICESLFTGGVLNKEALVGGGEFKSNTSRLLSQSSASLDWADIGEIFVSSGHFDPDSDEAGVQIAFSNDPSAGASTAKFGKLSTGNVLISMMILMSSLLLL